MSAERPRARPVADLPLEALLARSSEAARRWAIALILRRPLEALGAIPLEDLAAQAPPLFEQLMRALGSDAELELLLGASGAEGGVADSAPAWLGSLAGSPEPAALAEAAEALRGVAWELLLEELPGAGSQASAARLVGDVSDRLAESCAGLLIAAVATVAEEAPHVSGGEREDGPPGGGGPPAPSRSPAHAGRAPARGVGEPAIVIVDERRAAYASIERPPFRERVASAEIPGGAEIAIRDERGDEGPAAWVGSIGRQLERYERHGEPFAVLLLEARSDHAAGTELGYERLEDALEAELEGTGGSLTRERAGRYWALAPRTDRIGAEALAARLVLLTGAVAKRSGASITVLTGTAICPEDGTQAAALAAHADVGLYASRSDLSGRTRARGGHPADEPA